MNNFKVLLCDIYPTNKFSPKSYELRIQILNNFTIKNYPTNSRMLKDRNMKKMMEETYLRKSWKKHISVKNIHTNNEKIAPLGRKKEIFEFYG